MVKSDNRTVVSFINNQGGTKSLSLLTDTGLWLELAQTHSFTISARYLPGKYNGLADSLSRQSSLPDWHVMRRHSGPLPTMGPPGYRSLCLPPIGGGAAVRSPRSAGSSRRLHRCASLFGTIRKINLKKGWNRKPRSPECQKYIGSYGKSAEGSAEFRFGSFFKIKFSSCSE